MDSIWNWITTSPASGWIAALIAGLALGYTIFTRKRPQRLIFSRIEISEPLIVVGEQAKNIVVSYKGEKVTNLRTLIIELYNDGSETIKDVALNIKVEEPSRLLALNAVSAASADGSADPEFDHDQRAGIVEIPHINSFRDHKQTNLISIVLEGSISDVSIHGSGENWSIVDADAPTRWRKVLNIVIRILPLVVCLLFGLTSSQFMSLAPGKSKLSDVLILVILFFTALGVGALSLLIQHYQRPQTRSKQEVLRRLKAM